MAQLTDENIMDKVKEGQLSNLAELFDRYHVLLYNFFWKLTGDKAVGEDLTQTLFYRILRFRHTFNARAGGFKPWMFGMARNIHADYCRQKLKMSLVAIGDNGNDEEPEQTTASYEEQQYEQLQTALSRLGPVDRELIILSRYEGLKYADIAKLKSTSVGAVKVQVHRAMKALRLLYFNQQ